MTDYTSVLVGLLGSGNMVVLSLVLLSAIFAIIKGVRGELYKFYAFILILGLSFLTSKYVTVITIIIFGAYYGKKIYKGVER